MEPPFMPEMDKSNEMQFFNMDKGQEAMMDTMIPQNQVQRVKQQDNQFKDFDKNYIEK